MGLTLAPIDPMDALYWSAVINGFISVPIMIVMMLMVTRTDIMGSLRARRRLKILGWLSTCIMACAVAAMMLT